MGPQEHPRGEQQRVVLVELGELRVAPVVGPHVRTVQQRDGQVVVPDLWGRGGSGTNTLRALAVRPTQVPGNHRWGLLLLASAQPGAGARLRSGAAGFQRDPPPCWQLWPLQSSLWAWLGLTCPLHGNEAAWHSHPRPGLPQSRAALTFTVQSLEQDANW